MQGRFDSAQRPSVGSRCPDPARWSGSGSVSILPPSCELNRLQHYAPFSHRPQEYRSLFHGHPIATGTDSDRYPQRDGVDYLGYRMGFLPIQSTTYTRLSASVNLPITPTRPSPDRRGTSSGIASPSPERAPGSTNLAVVVIQTANIAHIGHRLTSANVPMPGPLRVLSLRQQQHGFLDIAEPDIGVVPQFLG